MYRVLIIEDELITANPVKEALSLESVEADIAQNGTQGLGMFKERDYDLVLLDLKMPGMSGEEVLAEIRDIDPFIDVIVYTNYSEFADIKKLTNIGIQGYINKGPGASLEELIILIMSKLAPLNEEDLVKLVKATPGNFFKD